MKILIIHYHHTSSINNNSENLNILNDTIFALDPRLKIFKFQPFEVKIFPLNCNEFINYYSRFLNFEFQPNRSESQVLTLLFKLLENHKPDIVYTTRPLDLPNSILKKLRKAWRKAKWVCYYGAQVSLPVKEAFSEYDHIVSGWKQIVNYLKKQNLNTSYLPHFYDEETVANLLQKKPEKEYKITFAGALTHGGDEFVQRRKYLESISKKFKLTLFSQIPQGYSAPFKSTKLRFQARLYDIAQKDSSLIAKFPVIRRYKNLTKRPKPEVFISSKLTRIAKPPVFSSDYYETIMKSRIFLNSYIEFNACDGTLGPLCGNIRTFEVTGSGTCLLTQDASNIEEFFEPERELVTFSTQESAVSKIKFLLDNPKERENIASRGRKRALRDHTLEKRIPQLSEILEKKVL